MAQLVGSLLLVWTVCLWTDQAKAAESLNSTTLDFVYVNANIGEAAGGHTAIRLGSDVFHFQFFPDGKFLLVRESWSHFRYIYNELRNRTIFVNQMVLAPEIFAKVKGHFTQQLVAQQKVLNSLRTVERERALLAQLNHGAAQLRLDTVGLFDYSGAIDKSVQQLQTTVKSILGSHFLEDKHTQLEIELAKYKTVVGSQVVLENWMVRLQELLLEQTFYHILDKKLPLAQESILKTTVGNQHLTSDQRHILREYRDQLAASIAGLINSQRPDRAKALLLQTARYLVISYSLKNNKLFTLDPFSSQAHVVNVADPDELQGLNSQLQQNAIQARDNFFQATEHVDIAYTILESSFGRLHELENAQNNGAAIRIETGMLLPQREGMISFNFSLDLSRLPFLLEKTKQKEWLLGRQINDQFGYHLIHRNCATELIRTLNSAFSDQSVGKIILGGWFNPDDYFVFIPHQFYNQASKRFPALQQKVFVSRRLRELNTMYQQGEVFQSWLNESNVLSSTLYRHRVTDTYFLMFTDDTILLRPVYGAVNVVWGAINSILGLLSFPVDDGTRLYQGVRGVFYSLPELIFGNIRKGTYGFAQFETVGP